MGKAMKILLLGAAGQVGSECESILSRSDYELISVTRRELDFACTGAISATIDKYSPDIVVNAIAYTAVDKAESEPELADQINHLSVEYLAQLCESRHVLLIHISTDYVFDGAARCPYSEDAVTNPQSVYGKSKLLGELAIQSLMSKYIILRTSWVFGINGNNFVNTMLRLATERDEVSVVDDQRGCPTYAGNIAEVLLVFIQRYTSGANIGWGVYHCVGQGDISWYEFASAIFDEAYAKNVIKKKPTILPIPSAAYPTPATRPMYSVLKTEKLDVFLGRKMTPWQDSLSIFLDHQRVVDNNV